MERTNLGAVANAEKASASYSHEGGQVMSGSVNARSLCASFEEALSALKRGHVVTRDGWNGRGQHLTLQTPDERSKMTRPYIYITTAQGDRVPWVASQTDLLAHDWIIGRMGECFQVI